MTDLASILQQAQNIVIKVAFKKKITPEAIVSCLSDMGHKNAKSMPRTILKEIAEGEECVITGHLVNSENHLGRSSIIDLNAPAGNNFRQVDHRTIQWIIYKNVKYSLGNKSTTEELPLKRDKQSKNFEVTQLQPGMWVCEVAYYKVKEDPDKDLVTVAVVQNTAAPFGCSRAILEEQFFHSSSYQSVEKVSRTEMVEKMLNAGNIAFTVTFDKKLDEDYIAEVMSDCKAADFNDP